ncbi:hypothetical protein X953_05685 [Virgibacillus sp. SK37]|nr:hypothetical protein X953_05685 [Virgibacillus sp. SK37]
MDGSLGYGVSCRDRSGGSRVRTDLLLQLEDLSRVKGGMSRIAG